MKLTKGKPFTRAERYEGMLEGDVRIRVCVKYPGEEKATLGVVPGQIDQPYIAATYGGECDGEGPV